MTYCVKLHILYTQKRVNLRQKGLTIKLRKFATQIAFRYRKYKLCVKLHTVFNYIYCVKITHCVQDYTFRTELHSLCKMSYFVKLQTVYV